uniref:Uncharacterized protein n=1 Tax=viral metagenome TaxID=1070528 RepID=A0A6H1ZKL4_9ZZZZ
MDITRCHNCNKQATRRTDAGVELCKTHYLSWYNIKYPPEPKEKQTMYNPNSRLRQQARLELIKAGKYNL